MLVDAFLFASEMMLLDIRLRELYERVDKFILVQSTQTFTGQPKPIYMGEQHQGATKMRYVTVNDMPQTDNPWEREYYQRNAILRGLADANPDDLVLIGDIDEIPRLSAIPTQVPLGFLYAFSQDFYYYNLNTRCKGKWLGTRLCRVEDLRRWTPQEARGRMSSPILNGGWHLSMMSGIAAIQKKLESFSHQEYNKPEFKHPAHIEQAIMEGRDLFDRDGLMQFERGDFATSLPKCIQQNKGWYAPLFAERMPA